MLSLSSMKDGAIVPSEEDRKKLLTQMKVKTTLRSDKSWIQKKSDSEEEKNHSPLHSPLRSRKTSERASISPKVSPLNHRAVFEELSSQSEQTFPVAKQPPKKSHHTTSPSGYLIRGVFTKTVDKNAPSNNVSNGLQKRGSDPLNMPATDTGETSGENASRTRPYRPETTQHPSDSGRESLRHAKHASSTPGYKMSTEDYKKLAPYTVKRDTAPDHIDPPVSPDEQQKRTEAASSVLRQTACKERSYVLSAAKKSNGSAAQEAPSFTVKRIEIEDDTGPRSRSQTMPASSWINNRGKSTTMERRNVWGVQRLSNASSTTSIDTGSRNQASKYSSGYSSAFNHFSSLENSNKQDQEKYNQTSGNDSSPKGSVSSPRRSEKNGKFQLTSGSETRDAVFSEDSWEGRKPQSPQVNQNSQFPYISPEASPKRSSFSYQTGEAETAAETHYQPKTRDYLNGKQADSARYVADQEEGTFSKEIKYDNLSSTITEDQPATAKSHSFVSDSIDTLPGEKYSEPTPISNDQDTDPKSSLSSLEKKTMQEEAHESPNETEYNKVEAHLAKSGSVSSEGSLSTAAIQTELPGAAKSEESALETARSGSISADSSVAPPESQQTYGSEADASSLSKRTTFGSFGSNYRRPTNLDHLVCNRSVLERGHRTSPYLNRQTSYAGMTTCGMPSYLNSQPYCTSMSEMNHTMTSYLSNPGFNSARSYPTARDSLIANPMRSHRVPFYKDICDADSRRYLPRPEERPLFTSSFSTPSPQPRYPSSSGYDSDPTTSSKALLFVKESINSTEMSSTPRYNSRSMVDLSTLERSKCSSAGSSYLQSSQPTWPTEDICTYCGREIRNCPKIKIEKLNICCHEFCFRCGICHKPMGDLLDKIYIHRDIVHCDKCYEKLF